MPTDNEQAELLARVAQLYFEQDEDQSAIARRLHVSRSSVSRLLAQARKQGIVEIRIHYPLALDTTLSAALAERFSLDAALVLRTPSSRGAGSSAQSSLPPLGVAQLAARYLAETLSSGDIVAVSRGRTLRAVVEQLDPLPLYNVKVVQLVGTLTAARAGADDANLALELARRLDGETFNLTVPLFVENVETRRALLQEPSIREVLDLGRHARIALVGIGALDRAASSILRGRLLSPAQLSALRRGHAVGEVCSQYFDETGRIVSSDLTARTLAIPLDALREIPLVVGVAAGRHKVRAMRGALCGGYLRVLITDDATARLVLSGGPTRRRPAPG